MRMTIRDLGYSPGQLKPGPKNSILDVKGVRIGQATIGEDGDNVRKGVTVLLPRHPDEISVPCYAGMHVLNGNGEVSGSYQIKDWGFTNTPLALTNSCSFGIVFHEIWQWTLKRAQGKGLSLSDISHNYGTPIVGETADWILNDVYNSALKEEDVLQAFNNAETQEEVHEGQHGGGAGMTCHMFPGGTGTSSRLVDDDERGKYTIGVIVQSNYGHTKDLQIGGVPVGKLLVKLRTPEEEAAIWNTPKAQQAVSGKADDGSILIYLITDAPLLPHQLTRVARHCAVGLGQVGGHGVGRNHSGDIIVALSTANRPNEVSNSKQGDGISVVELNRIEIIKNGSMDTMFRAASEATEEAILNSIVAGRAGRTGNGGYKLAGFPVEKVKALLQKHLVVV